MRNYWVINLVRFFFYHRIFIFHICCILVYQILFYLLYSYKIYLSFVLDFNYFEREVNFTDTVCVNPQLLLDYYYTSSS